jgi:hypothetical protein
MWWIIGACSLVTLVGVELRRFLRDRAEEAGPHRYALYAPDDPDRAILLVEVPSNRDAAPDRDQVASHTTNEHGATDR